MAATLWTLTYAVSRNWDYCTLPRIGRLIESGAVSEALALATEIGATLEETAVYYEGRVIRSQEREARMSDYSEYYTTWTVWTDEGKPVEKTFVDGVDQFVGGRHYYVKWEVDATPEILTAEAEYLTEQARIAAVHTSARKLVQTILEGVRHLYQIRRDHDVEVYKGRKVPKGGSYRVKWLGSGQFGDYANLLGPNGTEYKFVSLGNLRPQVSDHQTEYYHQIFAERFGDDTAVRIAREILKGHADGWGVLADRLREVRGDEFADAFVTETRRAV